MKERIDWKALALAIFAAAVTMPAPALAIGTVSDGGVTFGYTANFDTSSGNTVNADFTGAAAGDQLYESWWFFRVSGDTRETAFAAPDSEDYSLFGGSVGQLDWLDPSGAGLFSATLQFEAIETAPSEGVVFQQLEIVNTSLNPLTIDIFHYTDLDLSGSFGNDSASLVPNAEGVQLDISDPGTVAPFIGYGAEAYQVTTWRSLLNQLTDTGLTDLDNSGAPFGGASGADFTGAFQWSRTLGVGQASEFLVQFGSDSGLVPFEQTVVPEPGAALLVGLGLLGLTRIGRPAR